MNFRTFRTGKLLTEIYKYDFAELSPISIESDKIGDLFVLNLDVLEMSL